MGGPRRKTWIVFTTVILAACQAQGSDGPDRELQAAINWYTGVAGSVDDERAKELLTESLETPDIYSTMWLARVHSTGRMGYPADKPRAQEIAATVINEIEAAAEAGQLEAVFLMGTAYAEALGKPEDAAIAVEWYRRAADEGHVLAQHNLGNAYASGRGIEQSDSLAAVWWRQASERGDAITQLRLGEAHEAGRGVPLDLAMARHWYLLAAGAGNQQAADALTRLDETP